MQGVLTEEADKVSQTMVRWAEGLAREAIVLVEGVVQRPPQSQEDVHSTTIHEYEIKISKVSPPRFTRGVKLVIKRKSLAPCGLCTFDGTTIPG